MDRRLYALRLVGVGFYIVVCLLSGTFGGMWLDGKLNTRPLFVLLGLFLGLAVAAFGVYQMLLPLLSNHDNDKGKA